MTVKSSNAAANTPLILRSRVGHNAVLNFIGLAVPLALAFFMMPIAARYLGAARFGLLGLAWAITEYLTLFDLGLGRALVKFVADSIHDDSRELGEIVSVSMTAQLITGLVGGAIFSMASPLLVGHVFRVSADLSREAIGVFRVVGLSVPIVLLISGQRAVLEGAQRFDLSATIKMLSSLASLAIPAIGAVLGASLPAILLIVLATRIAVCVVYAFAIRRALPNLRWMKSRNLALLRRVLSFGGWVLVSNTVNPLLVYFDRFALGTIAGLAAVGFYTAPYEGVTRLLLVPVSLFGSLLPALTSIEAAGDRERFTHVAGASERVLAPLMAIPLAIVFVFAPELLHLWLGAEYAAQSASALRFLAAGVFANSLANPLFVMLYAKGRPDLPAKFHLAELVVHIPLTVYLIHGYGITGAAAAWATRVTLDMLLLLAGASRVAHTSLAGAVGGRIGRTLCAIVLLGAGLASSRQLAAVSPAGCISGIVLSVAVFVAVSWWWILASAERVAMAGTVGSYFRSLPGPATPG